MDGGGIAAALALGADGVQLGTAFLGCPECGVPEVHRQALAEAEQTTLGRVLTGRHARFVRTTYVEALERSGVGPLPFPLQAMVTADLRAAALDAGRADFLFQFAGQGVARLRTLPGPELVETLARETEEALARHGAGRA